MKRSLFNRRRFLKDAGTTAAGISLLSALPIPSIASPARANADKIRFSVIGINHAHIYSQVTAVIRGGGQLVSFFAKEKDLSDAFAKRYPNVKVATSEQEILD